MLEQVLQPLTLFLLAIIALYTIVLVVLLKKTARSSNATSTSVKKAQQTKQKITQQSQSEETLQQFKDRADEDELAILFTDIRGFTGLSEQMSPQELMNFLNSYFLRMNEPIHKNKGFIDKFIGDAVMALFDRPTGTNTDKAQDAIRAALDLRYAVNLYNQHRANSNYPPVNIGIGIHFGPVIIGTVGSDDRMDTTVLGDSVNIAFRLEALAPKYNTDIVISAQTLHQADAKGLFEYRLLDWVRVKGRKAPVEVYEIIDHQDSNLKQLKFANAKLIEQGLNYRKEQKWQQAITHFKQALEINPEDSLAIHHLEQCAILQNTELTDDWDGSILL
jgi:adenylate cyclase